MNTLMLLCGMGIGALGATILFLAVIFILSKEKNQAKEHFKRTEELLMERTKVQQEMLATLNSMSYTLDMIFRNPR